jgi:hypothetical protein
VTYPFLPDSPFTIAYALILAGGLAFVWIFGDSRARLIGAVMLADWLGTRAATAWGGDATALIAAGVDLSAAAALLFVPSLPARIIAGLFGAMLAFYGARDMQLLEYEPMWAMVDLLAYLQIAIMIGSGIDGLRLRRGRMALRRSRGVDALHGALDARRPSASSQRHGLAADRDGP